MKKWTILNTAILLFLTAFLFPGESSARSFTDLSEDDWAFEEIMELSGRQVISGFPDGSFRPYAGVKRNQAAIMVGRAVQIDTSGRPDPGFLDVSSSVAGYDYIAALTDEGVFAKASRFNPDDTLSRAEMAKILTEAFNLEGFVSKNLSDVPPSYWAHDWIMTLYANGLTEGTSSATYDPSGEVNRSQLSAFLTRVFELNGGGPPVVEENPVAEEMLDQINEIRRANGLSSLQIADDAQNVAQLKAEDMMENQYFSHNSPRYGSPFDMLREFNVSYRAAGENIAGGQSSVTEVMNAWMNSPGHRANMLNESYTHVGIGYAEGGTYRTYYVQIFLGR
ncbi:S-layer homology domain-containing protein [Jeotgalibacillus sp. JSM ZJ347]|uniref:CAP and S-layer homology domain-containing protein n=1 Tax=Jeotgalibacillus sp. JSM ZJ347 TaxID=3342117 RepID=UPI0035A82967